MGQCKSKTGALDNGVSGDDTENADIKDKKLSRRKWRKRKGYSLSASLEGDHNRQLDEHEAALKHREGSGPVLVSYNVTANDDNNLSARSSLSLCSLHRERSLAADTRQLSPIIDDDREEIIEEKADTGPNDANATADANADELKGSGTPHLTKRDTSYLLETRKNAETPQNVPDVVVKTQDLSSSSAGSKSSNCLNTPQSSDSSPEGK